MRPSEAEMLKALGCDPHGDYEFAELEAAEDLLSHAESITTDRNDVLTERERLKAALERIVAWDDAEKPHKNLPLEDCANLARDALKDQA